MNSLESNSVTHLLENWGQEKSAPRSELIDRTHLPYNFAHCSPATARRPKLRGDLDNITSKALRKEPERRYASVQSLASDIAAYLAGKPVSASKATMGYLPRSSSSGTNSLSVRPWRYSHRW